MNFQAVLVIALGAIALYVALHHLLYYILLRDRKEFLSFALTCLAIVYYDFACARLYLSVTPEGGRLWQVQQFAALAAAGIFLLMFVSHLIKRASRRWDYIFTAYWIVQLVLLNVADHSLICTELPSVKHVMRFGSMMVYYEMQPGILVNIQTIVGIIALVYILFSLGKAYKPENRNQILPVLVGMLVFAAGVANDSAVSSGFYDFYYCIEFSYLFLVLSMAFSLADLHLSAVRAQRDSEAKYRALLETANDAAFIADFETGLLLEVNRRAEQLVGRPRTELIGQPHTILHPQEHADHYRSLFFDNARKGGMIGGDLYVVHRDGRWIPVEISASRTTLGSRIVVQGLFRDVSERVRTEVELHRLAAAINAAAESIVITDEKGLIVYVNPCFERMTGYSRAEVTGKEPSVVGSGKHEKAFFQNMWATIASGQVWQGRFTNRRKDGSLFEEDAVISPVKDASGRIVNYVAVKRDVTQELALENQLRHSQKMEAVGRLAGGIAHDFTNMLVVILNNAQFARKKLPPDSEAAEHIKRVIEAAERSGVLTGELMAFAHQKPLSLHVVDLNKTLRGTEDMLRRTIDRKISFHLSPSHESHIVEIDPSQLEQALIHLAINACDAMPDGGHLTIVTETASMTRGDFIQLPNGIRRLERETTDYALLSLSDNGIGMNEDQQSHLFEPFFTTKGRGQSSGLGLSTTYAIVKNHHGYITCYSVPGKGSCLRIFLPLLEPPPHYAAGVPAGKETILVVEGNSLSRTYLVKLLQELGYSVYEAEDDLQARDILQRTGTSIDLLMANVILPRLDGRQLVLEALSRREGLRVLLLSGFPQAHLTACGDVRETDHVLSLPSTRGNVGRAVRAALS